MKIVRLFSFIILIGAHLSADSNSGNLPAPIPIDFGLNSEIRNNRTDCESCNIQYTCEWLDANSSNEYECCDENSCNEPLGALCCDEASELNPLFTCEVLETTYLWNCSDCNCLLDEGTDWTTDFGCMDDGFCTFDECGYDSPYYGIAACNLNSDAIWDDGSCSFTDDI